MKGTSKGLLLAVAVTVLLATRLKAQEVGGSVQGRVFGAGGQAQAEVWVGVSGRHLLGTRTTITGTDGFFRVAGLPPGEYVLRVTRIGFRPVVLERVRVELGRATTVGPVELSAQPVELGEVVVMAPAMTIDPVHTAVGATLDAEDYAALPTERDYKSIIAILPQVNTSYHGDPVNVGGSTGLENMYFIDGVNVTSTRTAGAGTNLPYNFVRAVEVKAGGYEAQYGKALGALVNAVTHSGTNDPEVSLFAFMTHSALAADPKAEPSLRELSAVSYDIGARVSGPILRDRVWYSAAYNPQVERIEKEITGHGSFADRRATHVFAGKLTWQAARPATVELSLFGDPTVHHSVAVPILIPTAATVINPDPFLLRLESGGVVGSLRASVDLGTRVRLEGVVTRSSGRESSLAETEVGRTESQYIDEFVGAVGGGLRLLSDRDDGRTGFSLRGRVVLDRHAVTFGTEYEDARLAITETTPGMGLIERTDDSIFRVLTQAFTGTWHNRVPTAYVQDSWRVTDRFTLNAGVRWSKQFLTGPTTGVVQRFPGEWQPRLGFVWQLGQAGTQRIFGSYGRFYQQTPLNLSSLFYVEVRWSNATYAADPRQPGAPLMDSIGGTDPEELYAKQVKRAEVEHFDEFTLGYERLLGSATRLVIRGVRRELRSSWQFGLDPSNSSFLFVVGTPGKGDFAFLPPPKREYTAFELGVEGRWRRLDFRASYVLSRTWGNYTGLFASDAGLANPGGNFTFFAPDQATNSTGFLPNDRPHVVKLVGTYQTGVGISVGAFFTWQSGTPVNEFAPGSAFGTATPVFLVPRGSAGRTPSIWDLNLRLSYAARWPASHSRVVLDLLHVSNPRQTVQVDQYRYRVEGVVNPQYFKPLAFQPPMMARLGFEVTF